VGEGKETGKGEMIGYGGGGGGEGTGEKSSNPAE
jgi:hypothetical protein